MKKTLQFFALLLLFGAYSQVNAQRYLSEIFSSVTVTSDVVYGENYQVLTGAPVLIDLVTDVYEPMGDWKAERPVIIYVHTGSFLPAVVNQTPTGSKTDSAAVAMCTQLAKRGYVVLAINYRLGWNPASTDQDVRTGTLLNAAYRGIQDLRTCVRWIHKNVDTGGNTYGINENKIIVLGQGTGGYISLGAGSLDKYSEISLPKFLNVSAAPYVDTTLSGDSYGFGGMVLNNENHVGYSSDIDFSVNLGGAVGDSTWLEDGDPAIVSFHSKNDPFAPYGYGTVIVPTTGDFVVEVSGSEHVQQIGNAFGNNDCFAIPAATWTDDYTMRANAENGGSEGLFPFVTPTPESAPWEWWDTSSTMHANGLATNPTMSKTKALAYIDTVMNYANPRIVACLGLDTTSVGVNDDQLEGLLSVYPNPASTSIQILLNKSNASISKIELFDLKGSLIRTETPTTGNRFTMERANLQNGLYLLKITSDQGVATRRVSFY